jgi:hypothetical protein
VSYVDEVLADSPLAYWRLGEPSGATAADSSGNGHDGTYEGSPTLGVSGSVAGDADTAATFDGSQHIQMMDTLGTMGSNMPTATIEFIWKGTTAAGGVVAYAAAATVGDATGFEIDVNRDADFNDVPGKMMFGFQDMVAWSAPGGVSADFEIDEAIYDGNPHHIVWQVTGTNPPSAACWVDGQSVTVTPSAANQGTGGTYNDFTSTNDLFVEAGGTGGSAAGAVGTLDEVAYYTTRLSGARIAAHAAAAGTGGGGADEPGVSDGGWKRTDAGFLLLTAGPADDFAAGFVRDADGDIAVTVGGAGQWSGGFLRDAAERLVVVEDAAGAWQSGFLRDAAGRLVVTQGAGPFTMQSGFLRDSEGRLAAKVNAA